MKACILRGETSATSATRRNNCNNCNTQHTARRDKCNKCNKRHEASYNSSLRPHTLATSATNAKRSLQKFAAASKAPSAMAFFPPLPSDGGLSAVILQLGKTCGSVLMKEPKPPVRKAHPHTCPSHSHTQHLMRQPMRLGCA